MGAVAAMMGVKAAAPKRTWVANGPEDLEYDVRNAVRNARFAKITIVPSDDGRVVGARDPRPKPIAWRIRPGDVCLYSFGPTVKVVPFRRET